MAIARTDEKDWHKSSTAPKNPNRSECLATSGVQYRRTAVIVPLKRPIIADFDCRQ
jgi:hypothetical protein